MPHQKTLPLTNAPKVALPPRLQDQKNVADKQRVHALSQLVHHLLSERCAPNADGMLAPTLHSRLAACSIEAQRPSIKKRPAAHFELLEKWLLKNQLVLSASPEVSAFDLPQRLQLSIEKFLAALGGKFVLKGSVVTAFSEKLRETGKTEATQQPLSTGLNDIDLAIQQTKLDIPKIEAMIAAAIRSAITASERKKLKNHSDGQLFSAFTLNAKQEESFYKIRLRVVRDESTPIDVLFYTQLPSDFDCQPSPDPLSINLHDKTLETVEHLDKKTRLWMAQNQLIWFSEHMSQGLHRISKHYAKNPDLICLNPEAIVHHFALEDVKNRAQFFCMRLSTHLSAVPESVINSVLAPLWDRLFAPTTDPGIEALQENICASLPEPVRRGCAKDGGQNDFCFTPTQRAALPQALKRCLTIYGNTHFDLQRFILQNPEAIPEPELIALLFPTPSLKMLSTHWQNPAVLSHQKIIDFLLPVTRHCLRVQNPHLHGQALSEFIHPLVGLAKATQNPLNEARAWALWFNAPEANAKTNKRAFEQILTLAKAVESQDLAPFFTLLTQAHLSAEHLLAINSLFSSVIETHLGLAIASQTTPVQGLALLCHVIGELERLSQILPAWVKQENTAIFDAAEPLFEQLRQLAAHVEHPALEQQLPCLATCLTQEINALSASPSTVVRGHSWSLYREASYLYLGQLKKGKAQQVRSPLGQGIGFVWTRSSTLLSGTFAKGKLTPLAQQSVTAEAYYALEAGGAADCLAFGKLILRPSAATQPYAAMAASLLPEVPFMDEYYGKSDMFVFRGQFNVSNVEAAMDKQPLETLYDGVLSTNTPHTNAADTPRLYFHFTAGALTAVNIVSWSGQSGLTLKALVKANGQLNLDAVQIDQTVPQLENCFRRTIGSFSPAHKTLQGKGRIELISLSDAMETQDGEPQVCEDARLLYCGEISGHLPHGAGELCVVGSTATIPVHYRHGKLSDPDLSAWIVNQKDNSGPALPTMPFTLPAREVDVFFSATSHNGGKLFGRWKHGLVEGEVHGIGSQGRGNYKGSMIAFPREFSVLARSTLGLEFLKPLYTGIDASGEQVDFFPHGIGSLQETPSAPAPTNIYWFGQPLPPDQIEHSYGLCHTISAPAPAGKNGEVRRFLLQPSENRAYLGCCIALDIEGASTFIFDGPGILFNGKKFLMGNFDTSTLKGAGQSLSLELSHYKGAFDANGPSFGEITFINGVRVASDYRSGRPKGPSTVTLPEGQRRFRVDLDCGKLQKKVLELMPDNTTRPLARAYYPDGTLISLLENLVHSKDMKI